MKISILCLLVSFIPCYMLSTEPKKILHETTCRFDHLIELEKLNRTNLTSFLKSLNNAINKEQIYFNNAKNNNNEQEIKCSGNIIEKLLQIEISAAIIPLKILQIRVDPNATTPIRSQLKSQL